MQSQTVNPSNNNSTEKDPSQTDSLQKEKTDISSLVRNIDTTKKYSEKDVKIYQTITINDGELLQYRTLKSSPIQFKNYNILYNNNYYNLGAYGKAAGPLFLNLDNNRFKIKQDVFNIYHYKEDNLLSYKTYSPYTLLSAVFNGSHEQIFNIKHTRNIKPNWNIGIDLRSHMGKGYYASSVINATKNFNISLWNWYQSPNTKYNLNTSLIINRDIVPESGGLINDNILTNNTETQPDFQEVYLKTARNEIKNLEIAINQSYSFITKKNYKTITDSVYNLQGPKSQSKPFLVPKIYYDFTYSSNKYLYLDKNNIPSVNNNFYTNFYINKKFTEDYIQTSKAKNQIRITANIQNSKIIIGDIQLGLEHAITTYKQASKDSNNINMLLINNDLSSLALNGKAQFNLNNYISLRIKPKYTIMGYNNQDSQIKLDLEMPKIIPNTTISYQQQNYEPDFTLQKYQSNHHKWENSFEKIHINSVIIKYNNDKIINIAAKAFLINNYVYLKEQDKSILPTQNNTTYQLLQIDINKVFNIGRYLKLNSAVIFQKVPEEIMVSPKIFTKHSLYYYNTLFTNLYIETGIDFAYYKLDRMYSYSPELSLFYITQENSKLNNNLNLTTDVFISGNLGNATFFVKYALINELLKYPKGFYTVNKYIMPYPSLSFGVSWRFYD
ncbi:MAG: putative porin [Solitalea-like symbiont of Acarus siro]